MELKRIREKRGMTQEQLADKSGISITMIQSLETGRRVGSVKTIIKLSQILGVTTDDLLRPLENTNSSI
ncbi:helix-turn-helix domain-containing protein [Lactobacillus selangorensis]|uniref:helix-turn-helix domain-containing protein n=1 Tax=Lactobacillus selangorensis TaxID=81857 RepID=UPI00070BF879|nr:helix-turn-helix transcriptional regulator [Lactobacillus selangorensis]